VFRRRRRGEADRPGSDSGTAEDDLEEYGDPEEPDSGDEPRPGRARGRHGRTSHGPVREASAEIGPWDGAGSVPPGDRMDFGSLLVPAAEGLDIQVNMAEDTGVWIAIVRGDSALQLQAFAAPKTSGLWDEVRLEISEEVANAGGNSDQVQGLFGTELHARVSPGGHRHQQLEPVRFIGVDGPRWFLRGVISGPAALHPELARPFEEVFGDVVVVRGDHPLPPRELLEIRLPEDAQRALQEQLEQETDGPGFANPFERGPEITETR